MRGINLSVHSRKDAAMTLTDLQNALTEKNVNNLFDQYSDKLHEKVDATRDAYFGFIFPINQTDFQALVHALDLDPIPARALYRRGQSFSTFKSNGRRGQLTNHIFGASILALRGKDLDSGLNTVNDLNISEFVEMHQNAVLEIAEARSSWFGRIFFPALAFSNAIAVFGGRVTPEAIFALAEKHGFAATAGKRQTVRGDFGIAVWLTLLATAT